ncbi:MAG: hypothetical protein M3Y09_10005 [Actinomycetota bacterium]|nr:hypothetical protein [Actinomycetota bacterium]
MTFILLNVILCSAVLLAVVAPLVWAIRTTQHDQPAIAKARLTRRPAVHTAARTRRRQYKPVI